MIRVRDIVDPELRKRVVQALAERNGVSVAAVPDWYEMDEADYAEIVVGLDEKAPELERPDDPRA